MVCSASNAFHDPENSTDGLHTYDRQYQLVTDFPVVEKLNTNPLVALPDGVCAVDLSVTVDTDEL